MMIIEMIIEVGEGKYFDLTTTHPLTDETNTKGARGEGAREDIGPLYSRNELMLSMVDFGPPVPRRPASILNKLWLWGLHEPVRVLCCVLAATRLFVFSR